MATDQSSLDERIERLRRRIPKDRRPSVADLITASGVSRSRWYRIMAGDGHFTVPEATRLAAALETTIAHLSDEEAPGQWEPDTAGPIADETVSGRELEDFFGSVERIIRTLSNQTGDKPMDPRTKLAVLNGIEAAAQAAGQKLPKEYWQLRESVLAGD